MENDLSRIVKELTEESTALVEKLRLKAVDKIIQKLGDASDADLCDITGLAAQICQVPIATITLIDENRQFYKGHFGLSPELQCSIDRKDAICNITIQTPDHATIIFDASLDERVSDLPMVNGECDTIRFYTGIPLVTHDGLAVGAICVIDHQPRLLSQSQITAVERLRNLAMRILLN